MITFRSTATGDVQMLDGHGAQLLAAMGRDDPTRGVIMPMQMDDAIARLQAATELASIAEQTAAAAQAEDDAADPQTPPPITLGQRAFPLLQMLRRSRIAGAPVLWGV